MQMPDGRKLSDDISSDVYKEDSSVLSVCLRPVQLWRNTPQASLKKKNKNFWNVQCMQQNTNPNPDPVEETSLDIARAKTRKMQHLQQNPDREEGPSSAAVNEYFHCYCCYL